MTDEEAFERLTQRGILPLTGDIEESHLQRLRGRLVKMRLEGREEATLLIDTPGGECQPSLWFHDFLRSDAISVTGVVTGQCSSMGVPILQGCTRRIATRHSEFFVHSLRLAFRFSLDEESLHKRFRQKVREGEGRQETIVRLLADRTGLTVRRVRMLMRQGDKEDAHISAQEALDLGFVDEVVDEFPLFSE